MDEYTYDPIDLGGPAIRLIRLLKGSGSEISCQLFQAWLHQQDNMISYEALSYTWGSTEIQERIVVNGKSLSITVNLYLALQQLRHQDEDRILWVDAICINQGHLKERGHQVQQMGDIFKQSDRVIFWLGSGTDETDAFMKSMQLWQRESIRHACKTWARSDPRWRDLWVKVHVESDYISISDYYSRLYSRQRRGLETILNRPWFRRVWILQEVANAKSALICCGTQSVSVRLLSLAPLMLDVVPTAHCQAVLDIMPGLWREDSWWSQSQNLYTLLKKFGRSEATESRDLIYALRGISSDARDADALIPDYEKPEKELARDVIPFIYQCDIEDFGISYLPSNIRTLMEELEELDSTLFLAFIKYRKTSKLEMLLELSEFDVDDRTLQTVASNDENGEVMELFLRYRGNESKLSEDVIMTVVGNQTGARETMEVIPRYQKNRINFIQLLEAATTNCKGGDKVMNLLLSYIREQGIDITDIATAAAENMGCGDKMMELLLPCIKKQGIDITNIATAAARNTSCGDKVMEVLLPCIKEQGIDITNIATAAARNIFRGERMMELLLPYIKEQGIDITNIATAAARNTGCGDEVMEVLLPCIKEQGIDITNIAMAAAENSFCEERIMELLLPYIKEQGIDITNIATTAARNTDHGDKMMKLLLPYIKE